MDPRYTRSLIRRAGVAVIGAKIALVTVAFDPLGLSAFVLPKTVVGNAFDFVLLGIIGGALLRFGRSAMNWSPLHVPVAAFALAYSLAAAFALDHRVALYGMPDRGLGLAAALDNVLLYLAIVMLVRSRTDVLWLGTALAASTLAVLAYEGIQWAGIDPVQWGRPSGETLFSTLGNRGVLAQFLSTMTVAAAAVAAMASQDSWRIRAPAIGIALLGLAGVLVAGGRAALIGLVAGGLALAFLLLISESDRRRRVLLGSGAVALIVAVVAIAAVSPIGQRFGALLRDPTALVGTTETGTDRSTAARLDLYRVALEIWRDRPLLGVGPDNYAIAFPRHRTVESLRLHDFQVAQTSTHSWAAKVATDAGLFGVLTFLIAIGLAALAAVRQGLSAWRLAAVSGIVAFLATGALSVNHVATDWLPWFGLGLIAASVVQGPFTPSTTAPRGRKKGRVRSGGTRAWSIAGVPLIIAGLTFAALNVKDPLEASRYAQVARVAGASEAITPQAVVRASQRAVALDPDRAEYWNDLGLAYAELENFRSSTQSLERAVGLAPYHSTYLMNLARTYVGLYRSGEKEALGKAVDVADRVAQVDPRSPAVHYVRALVLHAAGRFEEAAAESERALELRATPDLLAYQVAASAYLKIGRPDDAIRWIRLVVPGDRGDQPKLRALLASAFTAQGRSAEALQQVGLVLAVDPKNATAIEVTRAVASEHLKGGRSEGYAEWLQATLAEWRSSDLRNVLAEVLLDLGDRPGAAEALSDVLRADPANARARELHKRMISADVRRNLLSETLRERPDWKLQTGSTIGTVEGNVLTVDPSGSPWRVLIGSPNWTDLRLSVLLQLAGRGDESFDAGRWIDHQNAVFARLLPSQLILMSHVVGVERLLAAKVSRLRDGFWYWLEIEIRSGQITAIVYEAGPDPKPKSEARVWSVATADLPDPRFSSGELFLASRWQRPTKIGGVRERPGGLYVEELR